MVMDARDWSDLASVFQAGADRARGWSLNSDRQQDAEILDAQADRCDEIARDLNGNPPATHAHYHSHGYGKDRILHRHPHDHAVGETAHEGHAHERDPFAPLPSLWPGGSQS